VRRPCGIARAIAVLALFMTARTATAADSLLVLRDGRQFPVTRLERRGKLVVFTTTGGQQYSVPEDQVAEPPLDSIPRAGSAPRPRKPPRPAPSPRTVAPKKPRPPPLGFTRVTVSWPQTLLFQGVPMAETWDSGFPAAGPAAARATTSGRGSLRTGLPVLGGNVRLALSGALALRGEARSVPVASGTSTAEPDSPGYFGGGGELFALPDAAFAARLFQAGGADGPRPWAIKASAVYAASYLRAEEHGAVGIDPRLGTTRERQRLALSEAYGEVELFRIGESGFVSLRAGLQPYLSDPRGFVFADTNLGARLFGQAWNGRLRFNLAYLDLLEKDTYTGQLTFRDRQQRVMAAEASIADVFVPGYTISLSLLRNEDRASAAPHYDRTGLLVRPALVGTARPHNLDVNYFGLTGQGRWGPLDVSHATYAAFGSDKHNPIAGRHKEVVASFYAAEASLPRGRARYRLGGLISSGEDEVTDKRAAGFDAIVDGGDFAGGPFSYWSRTPLSLPGTAVLLKGPASVMPNVRSSRLEGQANFVNPGLILVNTGVDVRLTPRITGVLNGSYLWFHNTDSLEEVLFQDSIDTSIGLDLGVGAVYRKADGGLMIAGGVTGLLPTIGFDDVFRSFCDVDGCGHGRKKLMNAFLEVRFAY
jgi:hypothetical protein